ncbi:GNAT family N-acetyltransferase [Chromobacterium sp. IIBBL 290-4]|uniref:GNAT family N-acetyltransferase n=1 Tax=Chromobacterium sp. IIBBL 290-4 TaxID=2953890 RepID=UPI0020B67F6F|nr:GNAT family N-acetyltransferase [Chromobacterium sp. IIBBL 290-4]UTH72464.1 GNAT family N-acetyltransferase [Chromobacterium sp. IIBBL 290-4]
MNGISIRHAEAEDAEAIHAMMSDVRTFGDMLGLPYPSLHARRQKMAKRDASRIDLLAISPTGELAGLVMLLPYGKPRLPGAAELGVGVSAKWQSQGIGKLLMKEALAMADNWLGLRRLELTVFADNHRAQVLYRQFGFEEEARLRAYALRDGEYRDVLAMARLRPEGGAA